MRVADIFILILLITSEIGKKDACKDFNLRRTRKNTKTVQGTSHATYDYELLVVGAGALAEALLYQFTLPEYRRPLGERMFRIAITETKDCDEDQIPNAGDIVTAGRLFNTPAFSIDVKTTERDNNKFSDFTKWKNDDGPIKFDEKYEQFKSAAQRTDVAKYLVQRFSGSSSSLIEAAKNNGYEVNLECGRTVDDIEEQIDGEGFKVPLSATGTFTSTRDVVLATGQWQEEKEPDKGVNGYFTNPWSASALAAALKGQKDEHVGVLGTSFCAIEALVMAAESFGTFDNDGGGIVYNVYPEAGDFKVVLYSRGGEFPMVQGLTVSKENTKFTQKAVETILGLKANDDFSLLDEVYRLIQEEFREYKEYFTDEDKKIVSSQGYGKLNPEELFARIDEVIYKGNEGFQQRLRVDVERAEDSFRKNRPMALQSLFQNSLILLNKVAHRFLAEDTVRFAGAVGTKLYKLVTFLPLENAKKLLALMEPEDSYLIFRKIKDAKDIEPGSAQKKTHVKYAEGEDEHRFFINSMCQYGEMENNPSKLTKSLIRGGLIQPPRIEFQSETKAKEAMLNPKEKSKLFQDEQGIFFKAKGAKINLDNYRVFPTGRVKSGGVIYASGSHVYRYYASAQSFVMLVHGAEKVAEDIYRRYSSTAQVGA